MSHDLLLVSIADKLFRLWLFLYPKPFRQRFGDEMVQVFGDDTRHTLQEHGGLGWLGLCFRVFFDLLITAFAEHKREGIPMSLDKVTRFSGVAAFGAPFLVLSFTSITFWEIFGGILQAIGLPDGSYIHQSVIAISAVLMAIALFGLYRRLPQSQNLQNSAFFGLIIISCLFGFVASATLNMPVSDAVDPVDLIWLGLFLTLLIGIAGMGWTAWRNRLLGSWSFAPMLIAPSILAFIIVAVVYPDGSADLDDFLLNLFIASYTFGWWLLGVGLIATSDDAPKLKLHDAELIA